MTETEQMLTAILDCRRVDLYVDRPALTPAQREAFEKMKQRRAQGEPLQYILGRCEFFGFPFFVDKSVLIPRPETEILVETAIAKARQLKKAGLSILELGTGSGNIAVSLATMLPESAVTTVDVSAGALDIAGRNARFNEVSDRIKFIQADMRDFLKESKKFQKRFDIIISNPPYIKTLDLAILPADVRHEPVSALDGGEDGLEFIKYLIGHAGPVLYDHGCLLMEIGNGQNNDLCHMALADFRGLEFYKDYTDVDRIAVLTKC